MKFLNKFPQANMDLEEPLKDNYGSGYEKDIRR